MMEDHGENGVLVSGVISWIEIERHSGAAGIWKQVAKQCWSPEEVKEARKLLMLLISAKQVDEIKEKDKKFYKDRKNTLDPSERMMKEIEDISTILEFLENSKKMPLIMASTCQMRKSPKTLGSVESDASMGDILSKMMSMENCMAKFMDSSTKQMDSLKEAVREHKVIEDPKSFKETKNNPVKKKQKTVDDEDVTEVVVNSKESYASKTMAGMSQGPPHTNQTLKDVLVNLLENNSKQIEKIPEKKTEKPRRKHIFHGKATSSPEENVAEVSLAADVEIVAFGGLKLLSQNILKNSSKTKELLLRR